MGFYMEDNNKIKVYINDAYMKSALLDNKKSSVKVIRDTSAELSIFKKLNIDIPVVGINDLTELLADDIRPETIDTNSTFLFLRKDPFLAYLYLLKEGRAYADLKKDILFGSTFNTRVDSLLSFLNEKEDTGIDIFAPLRNQLRRYSNYSNPFELTPHDKRELKRRQSSTVIEPGFLNINYGNIFYIKNGAPSKETKILFSRVHFSSNQIQNNPLPTSPEIIGLLYSGITVSNVAVNHRISQWEIISYLIVTYAILLPIYALGILFSWTAPKLIASFLGQLSQNVYNDVENGANLIGLSRMLDSNNIFNSFLSSRKVGRIDWVEIDSIFNIVFKAADFSFNNRLSLTGKVFNLSEGEVNDIIADTFSENLKEREDNLDVFNSRNPDNASDLKNDWYLQVIRKAKGSLPESLENEFPFSFPTSEDYESETPPIFRMNEYSLMALPLSLVISTGDDPDTKLNNYWLSTLFLRTNYAYFEHIRSRNIKEPKLFQHTNKFYLDYILNNDMLMTKKDIGNGKSAVEIVNFGTSCFAKVVEELIDYVEDKTNGVTMDLERMLESITKIKDFLTDLDVSTLQFPINEKPYLPLAKVVLINYINWLLDDEKTPSDISEIFLINDTFLWELYVLTFYVRHSIYVLPLATNLITKNKVYRALCDDPTGGNSALYSLIDYIVTFRNNAYANLFGNYLLGNTRNIYDMMAGVIKKPYFD